MAANAIIILTSILVFSLIALVGAAVLGIDKGVLKAMGDKDYARGLITYLFAVVTIGTAAILGLSALTLPVSKEQFSEAKEILSLMLGIFGAIVGYYFGSESTKAGRSQPLSISAIRAQTDGSTNDKPILVQATVQGGTAPYSYGLAVDALVEPTAFVPPDGWISGEIKPSDVGTKSTVHVVVKDAAGSTARQSLSLARQSG